MNDAQYYISVYGENASRQFLKDLRMLEFLYKQDPNHVEYDTSVIDETVSLINEKMTGDGTIGRCKVCGIYTLWGGFEDDPSTWSCEECGDLFCDNCKHVSAEDDNVLCPDCQKEHNSHKSLS